MRAKQFHFAEHCGVVEQAAAGTDGDAATDLRWPGADLVTREAVDDEHRPRLVDGTISRTRPASRDNSAGMSKVRCARRCGRWSRTDGIGMNRLISCQVALFGL